MPEHVAQRISGGGAQSPGLRPGGLILALWVATIAGISGSTGAAAAALDPEINGVVIDRTLTPTGHAFARQFARIWGDQLIAGRHVIVIHELPNARWGNLLRIESAWRILYTTNLSPARFSVFEAAQQATQAVWQQLTAIPIDHAPGGDPDLGGDEL